MDMELIFSVMETHTLDNIDMVNLGEEEDMYGSQELFMKENLLKARKMEKEDGRNVKK